MGIIKRLHEAWKGLTGEDVERILRGSMSKDGPYKNLSTQQQLQIVKNNSIVFSCVTTIARAFQEAPIKIEQQDPDGVWSPTDNHPFLDPWQKNPDLSESDLKQYAAMHLALTGKSFFWKWRSPDGMTRELWPVPPSWVTINKVEKISPKPTDARVIESFTIRAGDNEWTVPVDDMVYTRFIDPTNLWDGLSPVQAASRYIQLEQKAEVYKGEAVSNLSLPGIIIKTRKPLGKRQKEDLRATLRQKMGGDARQNAMLVSGDDTQVEFLNPLKDFDWESYSDLDETRICSVFGVPPIVVGLWVGLKNSPWSNTGEAKRWMYRNTIKGYWNMAEVGWTRSLIPADKMPKPTRYAFCLEEIAELQDDITQRVERARGLFNDGIVTRAEAREMVEFDSTDDDRLFKYPATVILVPTDDGTFVELPDDDEDVITEEEHLEGAEQTDMV